MGRKSLSKQIKKAQKQEAYRKAGKRLKNMGCAEAISTMRADIARSG